MVSAWRSALLALAGVAAVLATAAPAHAQKPVFPSPSGYLVDAAGVISANDEQQIEASLRDFNQRTGGEVAVAIVKTIGDTSIENYTEDLFGRWRVGAAKEDDGVLLVLAIDERDSRLEPGYGAEAKITDVQSKQVLDGMRPLLTAGNYAGAVDLGQRSIRRLLGDPQADAAAPVAPPVRRQPRSSGGGSLLFFVLPFIVVTMMSSMGSRRRRRRGMGFGVPIFYGGGFGGGLGGGGFGGGSGGIGGGGGGFGGFGGGDSGGGGASGDW